MLVLVCETFLSIISWGVVYKASENKKDGERERERERERE